MYFRGIEKLGRLARTTDTQLELSGRLGRSAEYDLRYFRVFLVKYYSPFVTQITKSIFLQKAKVFIHFTGFSIWDWDRVLCCKEFGTYPPSLHVSVVRGSSQKTAFSN